jgi:Flp pilus assembly secretin CpaC
MAALAAFGAVAEEAEKVSLAVGAMKVVDLPFALQTFKAFAPDVVQAEAFTDRQLRLTGLKPGVCDVVVNGGGLTKQYTVVVLDDVRKLFDRLRSDLDGLPELDLAINQSYIVIRGEVSDIAHWKLLQQVLPMYDKSVQNLSTFRPKPESLVNLKKMLTDSGFAVVDEAIPKEPGKLGFAYSAESVTVTGRVYTKADIAAVQQVFATQEWLAHAGAEKTDGKIRLVLNLSVEPTMIDVSAVYVGVSSEEGSQIGSPNTFNISGQFSTLANLVRGGGATHQATIGAGLNPTMNFLAENGVNRFKTAGHLTFISNEEGTEASFHQGGTMNVRVQGVNSGDLKELPYGLTMKVSGGLIGANKVKLIVSLKRDDPPELNAAGDYDQRQSSVDTAVICGLDETVALAGMKEITEGTTGPNGLPYIRKIPVLSWFVSQKGEQFKDAQLLVLVSPRVATQDVSIKIPASAETADTLDQAETPNKIRIEAKEAEDKKTKPWWRRIF